MAWNFVVEEESSSSSSEEPVVHTCPWSFEATSSTAQSRSDDKGSEMQPPAAPHSLAATTSVPRCSDDESSEMQLDLKPDLNIQWVSFIHSQCEGPRRLRPRVARRLMRIGGTFSGLLPEIPAVDVMGIPADFCTTSELLPDVRAAAQRLHRNRYRKTFSRAEEHMAAVDGHGFGLLSVGYHKRLDLGLLSPACQPWSLLRERSGSGPSGRTCASPEDHPWWTQTFHLVPGWIAKVGPAGVVVEQVWQGFATDTMTDSGETDALKFFKVLVALFPSGGVRYVRLQLSAWTKGFSRSRTPYNA